MRTFLTRLLLPLALVFLCSCAGETLQSTDGRAFEDFRARFMEESLAANPPFAVGLGRHEFDGKLPDWSSEGLQREVNRLKTSREEALSFQNLTLNEQQRFELDYLLAVIDRQLFWLESAESPYRNPSFYRRGLDPNVYVAREYAPLEVRLRAYIDYAKAVPQATEQIKENLRAPLPKTFVQFGRNSFRGMASFFENDVPGVFAEVGDDELQAEFREANAAAILAMQDLSYWFEAQEEEATDEFMLGTEVFSKMLSDTERVDIPLDRLEEIGERDLERNLTALSGACAELAPEQPIANCVAKIQEEKPAGGPLEAARLQLKELKQFIIDRDIVSIPDVSAEVLVEEAPPYRRSNLAYINIPGPYEKNLPSVYRIVPPDPSWSEEEQRAYIPGKADLLFLSVHEVWPGHFLEFLHRKRSSSEVGRVYRGYAFSEGWAHYTEEMVWEAGLNEREPAVHIGQLVNALLRNVRLLSALRLHTGRMTVEESERMFREKAYQDPGNARQQAARGTYDPAYLNYTLGKLMIRKLRDDWTATRGGRQAWRDFHNQFLSYGSPPIPLVREAMLGPDSGPPL